MSFELTHADRTSPAWIRLSEHLKARLQELREQNDDPGASLSPEKSDRLRGRIAELKKLLALDQPEKK